MIQIILWTSHNLDSFENDGNGINVSQCMPLFHNISVYSAYMGKRSFSWVRIAKMIKFLTLNETHSHSYSDVVISIIPFDTQMVKMLYVLQGLICSNLTQHFINVPNYGE